MQLVLNLLMANELRWFFNSQLISLTTRWMQASITSWIMYSLTGSATWVSLAQLAFQFPSILISPLAGRLNDSSSKRGLFILLNVLSAIQSLTFFIVLIVHGETSWLILVLIAFLGCVSGIEMVTRFALVAERSGQNHMFDSISTITALSNLSRFLGPLVAAVLVEVSNYGTGILINAAASLIACVPVFFFSKISQEQNKNDAFRNEDQHITWAEYLRLNNYVYRLLFFLGCITAISFAIITLQPMLAKKQFAGSFTTFTNFQAAFAVGSFLGILIQQKVISLRACYKRLGLQVLVSGLLLLVLPLVANVSLFIIIIAVEGALLTSPFPLINSYLNSQCPPHIRGRLIGLYSIITLSAAAFSGLIYGMLADAYGVSAVFSLTSFAALLVGTMLFKLYKREDVSQVLIPA